MPALARSIDGVPSPTVLRIGLLALLALVLEIVCRSGLVDNTVIVAPSEMVAAFAEIVVSPELLASIKVTAIEIAIAAVLTVTVGFALGVVIHALPRLRAALDPVFSSYYALPLIAFYPLFIVIFGASKIPIIIMGFLVGSVAMIMSTLNGLDCVPKILDKVGRIHKMSPLAVVFVLKLPAAAPYVITGIRLSVAYVFIGVIASEFIMSGSGLGFAIAYAYNSFDAKTMYGLLLFLLVLVIALNSVLHLWDRAFRRGSRR